MASRRSAEAAPRRRGHPAAHRASCRRSVAQPTTSRQDHPQIGLCGHRALVHCSVRSPPRGILHREGELSGSAPRVRRPLLLVLVFGVFLAIIGITATAQAVMVSLNFSTSTLNTIVAGDAATVRAVLDDRVQLRYLDPSVGPTAVERAALETELAALTRPADILLVELRRLDGTIVAASRPGLAGTATAPESMAGAVAGTASAELLPVAE